MDSTPPPGNVTESKVQQLFNYDPSQGAAVALTIVFFVLALVQFYLYWKNKPNGYMLVLAFTALIGESLGYVIRIITIHNPTTGIFIITTLLILLSPCATVLVNYIVCGRVLGFTGQNVGCLRPNWIAKVFLISDVVTFLIQAMGGALTISTNSSTAKLGMNIVTAGLAIQVASFCLFIYVAVSIQSMQRYGFRDNRSAQNIFWGIHATMVCFIVRTVFRLIEFNAGHDGYAATHEWTMYAFDAGFMALAFVVYSWPSLHFGYNLNKLAAEHAAKFDGVTKPAPGSIGMSPASVTPFSPV